MKRPMIFIKGLSQSQLQHLETLSDYKHGRLFSQITDNTQVYTFSDGTLEIANNPAIGRYAEVVCTIYEDFLTKWEQYRLFQLL